MVSDQFRQSREIPAQGRFICHQSEGGPLKDKERLEAKIRLENVFIERGLWYFTAEFGKIPYPNSVMMKHV